MKKAQKKQLMAFLIIFVLFGSTIGFVVINAVPEEKQQNNQIEYNINHMLDAATRDMYMSYGLTLLELHFSEGCCEDLIVYVDSIEQTDIYKDGGTSQIVVQKIAESVEKPYIVAESMTGSERKEVKTISDIFSTLCMVMVSAPAECGAARLNWTGANITTANWTY